MHRVKPFVEFFKTMAQTIRRYSLQHTVSLRITADQAPDPQRYNLPTANEIGVLIPDNTNPDPQSQTRDIVLRTHSNDLQHISETHRFYDALHYVLILPHG